MVYRKVATVRRRELGGGEAERGGQRSHQRAHDLHAACQVCRRLRLHLLISQPFNQSWLIDARQSNPLSYLPTRQDNGLTDGQP